MSAETTYDAAQDTLAGLAREIGNGQLQLPDFQRGWVWDDEHITSIITSVARSFPVGAIMTLQTGGNVTFAPRYFEGVDLPRDAHGRPAVTASRLVLDGQQRLTSLFQALCFQSAIRTRDEKHRLADRFYYVDIQKALGTADQREAAVFSVPVSKQMKKDFGKTIVLDLSSTEQEYEAMAFPLNQTYSSDQWFSGWMKFWSYDPGKIELFNAFRAQFIDVFKTYSVPVIQLRKTASKEAVCRVFEKVNTGGVGLTAFELLTATYAADGYNLREDWFGGPSNVAGTNKGRKARLADAGRLLDVLENTDFLQCICLLYTHWGKIETDAGRGGKDVPTAISCTRQSILDMPLTGYRAYADAAEAGFRRAQQFLWTERIFWGRDLPYRTQLVPLAAILVCLGPEWNLGSVRERVRSWYWSGVFGEMYGGAIETRLARDLPEVVAWAKGGGAIPQTVQDCNPVTDRLRTLRSRQSAAYKGLHALVMQRDRAKDWLTTAGVDEQTYFDETIDIHHIFPEAWCRKNGLTPGVYDSIVNKTALSARTNRFLQGQAPSAYLKRIQDKTGWSSSKVDDLLASHFVDSECLREDDFFGMMVKRAGRLVEEIEAATGRKVGGESVVDVFGKSAIPSRDDDSEEAA